MVETATKVKKRPMKRHKPKTDTPPVKMKRGEAGGKAIAKASRERKEAKQHLNDVRIQTSTTLPAYTNAVLIAYRLAEYFYKQDNTRVSDNGSTAGYTEAGMCVALGIDNTTLKRYASKDMEYLTPEDKSREGKAVSRYITAYRCKEEIQPYYLYLIGVDPNILNTDDPVLQESAKTAIEETEKTLLMYVPIQKARLLITEQREQRLADRGRVGDIFTLKAREQWTDTPTDAITIQLRPDNQIEGAMKLLGLKK